MPRRSVITGQISHYPLRTRQTEAWQSSMSVAAQETVVALAAVVGDKFVFNIYEPIMVVEFRLVVAGAITYNTPSALAVVALDRRVTYGSDTGRVELGTITIPDAAPAGQQIYKAITPTNLDRGDQLVVEVKTQGAGGAGISGSWLPLILCQSIDFEARTPPEQDTGLTRSV